MTRRLTPAERHALALPAFVHVGPFDIAIRLIDDKQSDEAQAFGQFHSSELRIDILSGSKMPGKVAVVDTFIHEVLHAIFYVNTIKSKRTDEETLVSTIATGLTAVHEANPWLAGWIAKGVAKRKAGGA